jgi:hypothetical protein
MLPIVLESIMVLGEHRPTWNIRRQLQNIENNKQIEASFHYYLEELYGSPGSYQSLLLIKQGLLDADATSTWLKVANMCLPNFEQMLDAISLLGEGGTFTDFPSFAESLLKVNVNDEYFGNFVMLTSPMVFSNKTSRNLIDWVFKWLLFQHFNALSCLQHFGMNCKKTWQYHLLSFYV